MSTKLEVSPPSSIEAAKIILKKEFFERLKSKSFVTISAIFLVTIVIVALYLGREWKVSSVEFIGGMVGGILSSIFIGILAIVLSYDLIAGERNRKSLVLLLSKPVSKESIYLGKFLSVLLLLTIIFLPIMSLGFFLSGAAANKYPSLNDVKNGYLVMLTMLIGIGFLWTSVCLMLSGISKRSVTPLVITLMLWFFILPMISGIAEFTLMEKKSAQPQQNMTENQTTQLQTTTEEITIYHKFAFLCDPNAQTRGIIAHILDSSDPLKDRITTREGISASAIFFLTFPIGLFLFKKIKEE